MRHFQSPSPKILAQCVPTLEKGLRISSSRSHFHVQDDGLMKKRVLFMGNDIFALNNLRVLYENLYDFCIND